MEKNLVINHRTISYHGIFKTSELLSTLKNSLEEKGYKPREKKSEDLITPSGRMLDLELRPYKTVSQYLTLMIKIHLTLDNVTETSKQISGEKHSFQKGDLHLTFDAWSMTDYESRWGTKPLNFFLKGVIQKYLYKFPAEEGWVHQLTIDTAYIYGKIKSLLQSYEGKKVTPMREDEILRNVEEEFLKIK
ncbi:MAG TPA: hypothetical protein VJB13_00905 [Candidatus Nanoarchaeia archaeon]|nr:hypothetical protein [Candidatus Nanoarchaeia archaeon]